MNKIAIVYWSGTGNTESMANILEDSIRDAGGEPEVIYCTDFTPDDMDRYDLIAFGCPAMGDEELEEDEFRPMFDDCKSKLSGKKIALFGSYSWADGEWIETWAEECRDSGANLVEDPVAAYDAPDREAEAALRDLGQKIANA